MQLYCKHILNNNKQFGYFDSILAMLFIKQRQKVYTLLLYKYTNTVYKIILISPTDFT